MNTKRVSILIVGGNAAASINLSPKQGYVDRLHQRLQRAGWMVDLELHTPVSVRTALPLLYRLDLNRYDLIVLQPDSLCGAETAWLCQQGREAAQYGFIAPAPSVATSSGVRLPTGLKLLKLRILHALNRLKILNEEEARLTDILYYLEPFRRRLILQTPIPHPRSVTGWLRRQSRQLFRVKGREHLIAVFDTSVAIQERSEFFDDTPQGNLSPVAHDLLGQSLFEFIQVNALLPDRPQRHPRQY